MKEKELIIEYLWEGVHIQKSLQYWYAATWYSNIISNFWHAFFIFTHSYTDMVSRVNCTVVEVFQCLSSGNTNSWSFFIVIQYSFKGIHNKIIKSISCNIL